MPILLLTEHSAQQCWLCCGSATVCIEQLHVVHNDIFVVYLLGQARVWVPSGGHNVKQITVDQCGK